MKRVFIVHGWDGSPSEGWFPWLKSELEKRGYAAQVPAMPDSGNPKIEAWVGALAQLVGKPDGNTYFIGHSIGCQAILRYLSTLPKGSVVGGAVFVSGWFTLDLSKSEHGLEEAMKVASPWLQTTIDTDAIRKVLKRSAALFSGTDVWVPIENKAMFESRLGSETKVVACGGQGHFSGDDGVTELPEDLEFLLLMSATPIITIDDLAKIEIKMGSILTAEKVEGADKLLKFSVDLGGEVRTIVSGVAQHYAPESMIGKQVPVVTNLAPRKMKGVESNGMILYAIDETVTNGVALHKPVMLNPEESVPNGSPVQ
ncbi:MAG: hypothetical protein QG628_409 [Patescibacteria group bacterium]|nr:hypothetical protein [Patescibacteria group bacterium]